MKKLECVNESAIMQMLDLTFLFLNSFFFIEKLQK